MDMNFVVDFIIVLKLCVYGYQIRSNYPEFQMMQDE